MLERAPFVTARQYHDAFIVFCYILNRIEGKKGIAQLKRARRNAMQACLKFNAKFKVLHLIICRGYF